jgi:anthranilate phosphoribosyltransferase
MQKLKEFTQLLNKNKIIDKNQSYEAFNLIADGAADNEEIKEFLLLINELGISEELLFGAVRSLSERSIKVKAPESSIDVCGTGGDNSNSLNISTTVSIVIASMGIAVAKHGNKAVSSKSGSADIFKEIGISLDKNKTEVEALLKDNNLAFIYAPIYHPALKNVSKSRKELGVRTIFNFLGPLLNPAQTQSQLIGCCDKDIAKIMIKVCALMNKKQCMVVTGMDGMDEISISANTIINKIDSEGNIIEEIFNPEDYQVKKRNIKLIEGVDLKYNTQKMIQLLKGDINDDAMLAYRDIVSINCAAALIVSGRFKDFKSAIETSREQIESGKVYNFLQNYISLN